jgi:hypothetical protein
MFEEKKPIKEMLYVDATDPPSNAFLAEARSGLDPACQRPVKPPIKARYRRLFWLLGSRATPNRTQTNLKQIIVQCQTFVKYDSNKNLKTYTKLEQKTQ